MRLKISIRRSLDVFFPCPRGEHTNLENRSLNGSMNDSNRGRCLFVFLNPCYDFFNAQNENAHPGSSHNFMSSGEAWRDSLQVRPHEGRAGSVWLSKSNSLGHGVTPSQGPPPAQIRARPDPGDGAEACSDPHSEQPQSSPDP